MKINIESIHFSSDKTLIEHTEQKIEKLKKVFNRIIDVNVHFRINKGNERRNKHVDIRLNIPQHQFFAKEQASTFEEGVDNCIDVLVRQLRKYKDKRSSY